MQFNVVSRETLLAAQAHPENYKLENEEDEAERERSSRVWEEGYVVRNKNTEGLGKIGQMAHILAPSDGEEESSGTEEPAAPETAEIQEEE